MKIAITDARVEKYFYGLLPPRDAVLREMEALARKNDIPIVGPAVGRLLALLVKISGAKRIFEMGSAIGYSTIWFARAAGRGAEVFYTDGDPTNAEKARAYFRRAGVAGRIRVGTGDSLRLLRQSSGKFDLIFIDVDKHQYPAALRIALPRLKHGGLLITDNTLWSGRVTQKSKEKTTRGIQEFNRLTHSSKKLFPVLIPLRDGVTVCQKL
jgi:predicted O-methyltransferase YrrM